MRTKVLQQLEAKSRLEARASQTAFPGTGSHNCAGGMPKLGKQSSVSPNSNGTELSAVEARRHPCEEAELGKVQADGMYQVLFASTQEFNLFSFECNRALWTWREGGSPDLYAEGAVFQYSELINSMRTEHWHALI